MSACVCVCMCVRTYADTLRMGQASLKQEKITSMLNDK